MEGEAQLSTPAEGRSNTVALALLTLLPLLGGAGVFVVGRVAVAQVSPVLLAWLRFAGAAAVLLALRGLRVVPWSLRRSDLPSLLLMALTGTVAYNLTLFYGLRLAPATDAGLITLAEAPLQVLLGRLLLGERLPPRAWPGLMLSGVGLVMVVGVVGGHVSPSRLAGDLLLLGSAVCWPLYAVFGRRAAASVAPLPAVTVSSVVGALGLLPWVVLTGGLGRMGTFPASAWLSVAYLALPATVGNWTAYYWAVSRVGAVRAAAFANLVPVWTLALAIPLLHEIPTSGQIAGAVLAVAGVWLAGRLRTRAAGEVAPRASQG